MSQIISVKLFVHLLLTRLHVYSLQSVSLFIDMGSPDLKKIESYKDIRKTRNVVTNLRFCGKRKDCTKQLSILKL